MRHTQKLSSSLYFPIMRAALLLLFIVVATSDAFSLGGGVRAFGLKRPQQGLRSTPTSDDQGFSSSQEALGKLPPPSLQSVRVSSISTITTNTLSYFTLKTTKP